mmetsp:Transcript_22092/g.56430  ORF Transcript_22092/g.56430 Transcript_22092/m.56430 type:complete len:200 (-) Transcript_22092:662-1261(-)
MHPCCSHSNDTYESRSMLNRNAFVSPVPCSLFPGFWLISAGTWRLSSTPARDVWKLQLHAHTLAAKEREHARAHSDSERTHMATTHPQHSWSRMRAAAEEPARRGAITLVCLAPQVPDAWARHHEAQRASRQFWRAPSPQSRNSSPPALPQQARSMQPGKRPMPAHPPWRGSQGPLQSQCSSAPQCTPPWIWRPVQSRR